MESAESKLGRIHREKHLPGCFAGALAVLLVSASLSAAPRPRGVTVHLDYERGPGARQCPGEILVRREVAAELGKDRFAEAGPWRLHATVNRTKNGAFAATASLFDSDGATYSAMREVVSVDCPELVKSLAFWISVQLTDPRQSPALPLPAASTSPVLTTSVLPPATPSPPPTPLPSAALTSTSLPVAPPPLFRVRLGAASGIDFGVGPTPSPLFSLSAALQSTTVPIISIAFEGRADLPLPATGEGGTRIHTRVITGAVMTCFHAFDEGLLYFCPMFSAGVISSGERLSTADVSASYSAAGGRVGAAIPFASGRFAFTVAGDMLATLHPFQLRLEERYVLWETRPLTGALQAGVSTFF